MVLEKKEHKTPFGFFFLIKTHRNLIENQWCNYYKNKMLVSLSDYFGGLNKSNQRSAPGRTTCFHSVHVFQL